MPQAVVASSRTPFKRVSSSNASAHVYLHGGRDALPVAQDLVQGLCAKDVPEGGLRQQTRGVMRVLHVSHGHRGVGDPVVDDGVYGDRHGVSRQDLLRRHAQSDCPEERSSG